MNCMWCNHKSEELHPIDRQGSKDRRWVCNECLSNLHPVVARYLYKRGQKRTLWLNIKVLYNKIADWFIYGKID